MLETSIKNLGLKSLQGRCGHNGSCSPENFSSKSYGNSNQRMPWKQAPFIREWTKPAIFPEPEDCLLVCLFRWLLFRVCCWLIFPLVQGCRRARVCAMYCEPYHFHSQRRMETWIQHPHSSQGEPQWWISFGVFSTPCCQCGWTGEQLRSLKKAFWWILMCYSALGLCLNMWRDIVWATAKAWGCNTNP